MRSAGGGGGRSEFFQKEFFPPQNILGRFSPHLDRHAPRWHRLLAVGRRPWHFEETAAGPCSGVGRARGWQLAPRSASAEKSRSGTSGRAAPETAERVPGIKEQKQPKQSDGVSARSAEEEEGNTQKEVPPPVPVYSTGCSSHSDGSKKKTPSVASSLPVCLVCCRWTSVRVRLKLPHCNRRRRQQRSEKEEDYCPLVRLAENTGRSEGN